MVRIDRLMNASDSSAVFPSRESRFPVTFHEGVHPSLILEEELWSHCENRFQRRSGPGGQHRNKTSSGVFLTHRSTGLVAEATERRSQADNRKVAMHRLRLLLATELRSVSVFDKEPLAEIEMGLRLKYEGSSLRIGESNHDRAAVLAVLLNDLHAAGGQPSLVANPWRVSTSAITRLLKSYPEAFAWVNRCRNHHGRKHLK